MKELEFEKNLVVGMCHITEEDSEFCCNESYEGPDHFLSIHNTEYFYLVYVINDEQTLTAIKENLSDSFLKLYQLALDNQCDYLKIDRDGPEIEGFEKYDW